MKVVLGLGSSGGASENVNRKRKSISTERTFREISEENELLAKCQELAESLAADLQKKELKGKTLTVKLKNVDFQVRSRSITLPKYICSASDICQYASDIIKLEMPLRLRLMGIRMSQLQQKKEPLCTGSIEELFKNAQKQNSNLQRKRSAHEQDKLGKTFIEVIELDSEEEQDMAHQLNIDDNQRKKAKIIQTKNKKAAQITALDKWLVKKAVN